jgi:hypothetical protein
LVCSVPGTITFAQGVPRANCKPPMISVHHANGGRVCIYPLRNRAEYVASSLRNGWPLAQSFCARRI